jgi:ABC-type antimicrobial peptide transport system permease subunit
LTRLRTELRSRWRAWAAVALLIGVTGGVVLTTAAGARRTDTAYARFLEQSHASDVLVSPTNRGFPDYYDALARQPDVRDVGVGVGVEAFVTGAKASPGTPGSSSLGAGFQLLVAADTHMGARIDKPKVAQGRMFRPDRPDEIVADRNLADAFHLHAGSVLHAIVAPTTASGVDASKGRPVTFKVVGVIATRDDVVPANALASAPSAMATPAFLRQFGLNGDAYTTYTAFDGAYIRLKPGVSRAAFTGQAQELAAQYAMTGAPDFPIFVADEHHQAAVVEHAIRPQATALALFSLLAAISALFVVGQILSRQLFIAAGDNPTLAALGMGRGQLFALGLVEAAIVATVGALVAVAVAIAASPYMPIGPARVAEPHPGVSANWAILGLGVLAMIVLLVARVAWPAWRMAKAHASTQGTLDVPSADRTSRIVEEATRAGAPASAAVGIRLALEPGRGRTAVPVRSALAGTVLAVAAVAAAFTFGSNLVRLVHTPKLYGQTWTLAVDTQFGRLPPDETVAFLEKQSGVTGWTFGDHLNVTIAGKNVTTIGLAPGRGRETWPTIVEGRAPSAPDEIALGTKTLTAAHRHVGDTVTVTPQGESEGQPMKIVGRAVFPFFGQGDFTPTNLGDGAAIQDPQREPSPEDPAGSNFVLVRVAPRGATVASIARFRDNLQHAEGVCPQDQVCEVETAKRPVDVLNYSRIQTTPLALAGLLALLAVATVAHLLVTSIRRRRRDLAVLKTMGFVRGQVSAAVAWQATTLVLLALFVGLPLGVAGGRWIWQVFADRIGINPDPRVPLLTLALFIPVALVVANLLAAGPGWVAGRLKPAPVLRTE